MEGNRKGNAESEEGWINIWFNCNIVSFPFIWNGEHVSWKSTQNPSINILHTKIANEPCILERNYDFMEWILSEFDLMLDWNLCNFSTELDHVWSVCYYSITNLNSNWDSYRKVGKTSDVRSKALAFTIWSILCPLIWKDRCSVIGELCYFNCFYFLIII